MSGRTFNLSGYRYGFNGKENDIETVGTGEGTQDYGMRIYNPSLGKFLSVDPLQMEYPMLTPYQFASNSPIVGIDRDGLEIAHYSLTYSNGKPVLQLLGVQMRLAAATEDLLEAFGVDYTLNEYSGSIINGLSFKVFYDGAEFTFSTVGDVANFAKGGEEKAKAARAAYIAEQLMIAVAVTDLKQAELESEQAFVDSYSSVDLDEVPIPTLNNTKKQQESSNNGVNSNGETTIVRGGAKLENLTKTNIKRIQDVANKYNLKISVVGSQAKGTANEFSDWDYINT